MGVKFIGLEPCSSFGGEIPACPHGPMLLFERADGGRKAGRQFYACAACRDRKACAFFLWRDERLAPEKARQWRERVARATAAAPVADHRARFLRAEEILRLGGRYCVDCSQVLAGSEASLHSAHETRPVDPTLVRPSELLRPRSANSSEAQYLFSEATLAALLTLLNAAGARRVLCCGAPRLHERLQQQPGGPQSLMLDCDRRYEEFWPPEKLCVYNMFNHHMFCTHGWDVYREFVQRDGGEGLVVVIDPPFGGRLEALALTLQSITVTRDAAEGRPATSTLLPVFLILPYFNEPDVLRSLPALHMTDMRVEYENHHKYTSAAGGRKHGSPVRLFTSLPAERVELPPPLYRRCPPCRRWVHVDNRHCPQCDRCTSKDGRPYQHCDLCERCVKITWRHCSGCGRCALPAHPCAAERPAALSRPRDSTTGQKRKRRK
ncbi:rRNA N6-adenosine-methyltransferase ZCCHC4-like isoform X2 [Pollicipes pollicipes]|uniref:rRNA N6-adenosine-methyltransferase ZCCHC4-like isoform X2 n=1 Tax=Pollicipes pollicipes TaxID=41117 RepID=UPI0018858FBD|nr:rRNA N6-adenosine-methyltransferase ZCCHC4-like isoform X2 [Pollicipes pollicipes]